MFLLVSGGHVCVPERDTNMASPYKALEIWLKRFSEYLACELLDRPDSWQGFLYIYLLSFPRFQTFCIKRFPFSFLLSHVSEKVSTCFDISNRPLPFHLHLHEISKFLDSATQFLLNKCRQIASLFNFNPFAPGDFAQKRVLKLVEWFSGHGHAIKS